MLELSSVSATARAIARAHRVVFAAYVLQPGGTIERALADACRHGAQVTVRLQGGLRARDMEGRNRNVIRELRAAGADVRLLRESKSLPELHLKAAVCDGVAYLSDCNWRERGGTIVRDASRADGRSVEAAIFQRGAGGTSALALDKDRALQQEADLVRSARRGDTVRVQSETFGWSRVSSALRDAVSRKVHCRLLLSSDALKSPKRMKLARLMAQSGVDVRASRSTEKFAVVRGKVWIGSANASPSWREYDSVEWGLEPGGAVLRRHLRRQFDDAWRGAEKITG